METLRALRAQGNLDDLDVQIADLLVRLSDTDDLSLLLGAALASHGLQSGHVCLDLAALAGSRFPERAASGEERANREAERVSVTLPTLEHWRAALASERARSCVGGPGDAKPLILENNRLYLRRYWQYEKALADALRARAETVALAAMPPGIGPRLRELFPDPADRGGDRQRLAAYLALRNRLTIVTGGPGTGKTHTVARILALLQEIRAESRPLRVSLAAPTGKAVARLTQAILDSGLPCGQVEDAATIHRLLGLVPDSPRARRDRRNPIEADVVIVDEASMINLALMARLVDAVAEDTRLVLLGDMHQLPSVEAGNVFGDICLAARPDDFSAAVREGFESSTGCRLEDPSLRWGSGDALSDCLVRLSYSHRFAPERIVARLSGAINAGESDRAWRILQETPPVRTVIWHKTGRDLKDGEGRPCRDFRTAVLEGYKPLLDATTPKECFAALRQFCILCAVRAGPFGVRTLNRLVEDVLSLKGFQDVPPALMPRAALSPDRPFYDHRVIMITRNDYSLGVFNGTVGIVLPDPDAPGDSRLAAYFEAPDRRPGDPEYRRIAVSMLPEHETAFATTIHKAQGSEFERLMLVLPERPSPVLTRELLYTGITRVKNRERVDVWCTEEIFRFCVETPTVRLSRLGARLRAQGA